MERMLHTATAMPMSSSTVRFMIILQKAKGSFELSIVFPTKKPCTLAS